jgi:hypothetical protein
MTLSPTLRAELAKMNDAEILHLLGEIINPSINSPFETSDDLNDELIPVNEAYCEAYRSLEYVVSGEYHADRMRDR